MNATRLAWVLTLAFWLFSAMVHSQTNPTKSPEFDHHAIHVHDLAKSVEFYEKVMGLEKIPEPFKDGRHIWFRVGPHSQLHIVGGATEVPAQPIDIHMAFRVASITDFMARLDKMQVKYRSFKGDDKMNTRPDGVHQIYFQDLDSYWIEVNDGSY